MTTLLLLQIVSIVVALAWLPLLIRFLRRWRARLHPVSLAITSAILLYMLSDAAMFWLFRPDVRGEYVLLTIRVAELLICVHFYVAFRVGDLRERDAPANGRPDGQA